MIKAFPQLLAIVLALAGATSGSAAGGWSWGARLTDASGAPLAGPLDLELRFFASATATAALPVGPLEFADVALKDGVFSLDLALAPADLDALYAQSGTTEVWLELEDVTHGKVYPRQRLNAVPWAMRVPVDGDSLGWDAATGRLAVREAPTFTEPLAGDVEGAQDETTVVALQGRTVSSSAPASGEVLTWSGSAWAPAAVTLADAGCAPTEILKWSGSAWACAADDGAGGAATTDASQLTTGTLPAARIGDGGIAGTKLADGAVTTAKLADGDVTAAKLASNGCATNEILKWSGATWICAADADTTTTDASLLTTGTLPDGRLAANVSRFGAAVDTGEIADDAVTAAKLAPSGCTNDQILKYNGTDWVCGADVDTNTPTTNAGDLTAGTLDDARLSANVSLFGASVESDEITDGTIAADDIGAGAVGDAQVAAGINAAKIGANTNVSNAEYGYLDGVTSAIQTQLGARVLDTGDTMTGALVLDPVGAAGAVDAVVIKDSQRLKLENAEASPNSVTFRAATGVFTDQTYVLPTAVGTNGQVLRTDGSGNLSWWTPGNTVSDIEQITINCAAGLVLKSDGNGDWSCQSDATAGGAGSIPDDNSVSTIKIVDDAVTADKLNSMGCSNGQILEYNGSTWVCAADDNNNVTTNASLLTSGTLADAQLSANVSLLGATIGTAELEDDAVDLLKLADDAVDSAAIVDGAVAAVDLAGAIPDSKLSTIATVGKVSGDAITSGTIGGTAAVNSSGTLRSSGNVVVGSTGSAATELRFQDDDNTNYVGFKAPATVGTNKVWTLPANDTAGGVLSTNGSGVLSWTTGLAPSGSAGGALTGTYPNPTIAANAVTAAEIAAGAVTTSELLDGTVATDDVADGAITTAKLGDAQVTNAKLAANAVTTAEIAADTIAAGDIATGAVTTTEILDGTVAAGDLAGAIPDSKLSTITTAGKVSGAAITSGTIGGAAAIDSSGSVRTSGNVVVASTGSAATELRFHDADDTHYVGFKAPATVGTSRIWTLPSDDLAGGVLATNGSGTLSWNAGVVVGPASATSGAIARYDGTTGKLLKDSGALLDDSGNLGLGRAPSVRLDVDGAVRITDGNEADGKVLTSGATGIASWQTPPYFGQQCPAGEHVVGFTATGGIVCSNDVELRFSDVRSGVHQVCTSMSDQTLACSGYNAQGQLGDGTTSQRNTPVYVLMADDTQLSGVTSFDVGYYDTCAVSGGKVYCWGRNDYNQIGDGTTTVRHNPTEVSGITTATQVAVGGHHACALLADGTMKCWGYNYYGALGDGTTTQRSTPVAVTGLTNVTQMSTGFYHTCARKSDGTIWCWGYNGYGQIGDATYTARSSPVQVTALTGMTKVVASINYHSDGSTYDQTCALKSDGTVWCWGYGGWGSLGDGATSNRTSPVQAKFDDDGGACDGNVTGVTDLDVGGFLLCVLMADKTVRCAGYDGYYALGNDDTAAYKSCLVRVKGLNGSGFLKNVGKLAVPAYLYNNAHVVFADGSAASWGYNTYGEIGDGTTTHRNYPVKRVMP